MCDGDFREGTPNENEGGHTPANAMTRNAMRTGYAASHHLWGNNGPSWSNSVSFRESSRKSNNSWRNYAQRSSKSSGVTTMAARLDVELMTSTATTVIMLAVIIYHSSPEQARMLPPWQSSSGRCPNHQIWRGGKPTRSCVPFSNVPRCSRPKAPCLDGVVPRSTSPHRQRHERHARRKPWSTQNNKRWG
jgi:hypothetical protein